MAFNKLTIVLLLALGASQIQAAPKPTPKNLEDVALKVIQIVKIIGEKLNSGIEEARPIIEALEAELNADLAANVHDLLSKLEDDVKQIVDRVKVLEQEVTDSIDAINKEAKSCNDQVDVDLDKTLDVAEKNISDYLNSLLTKYDSNITSIKSQIVDTIKTLDAATDKAIAGGVACVKKGSKTVKKCLDDNSEEWNGAVTTAIVNLTLVLNEALALIQEVVPLLIAKAQEIGAAVKTEGDPAWVKYGDCVANLS